MVFSLVSKVKVLKSAHTTTRCFKLHVSNPLRPMTRLHNSSGTRLALNIIEARLKVLFGPNARLSIINNSIVTPQVWFHLPDPSRGATQDEDLNC